MRGLLSYASIACILGLFANPVAAKKQPPNLKAAQADPEFRCVVNWAIFLPLQAREPGADQKALVGLVDRIDPFFSEVQNKFVDTYHMSDAALAPIMASYSEQAKINYDKDKVTATAEQERNCLPLLEARESLRVPHTPMRCAALMRSEALLSTLSGLTFGPQDQIGVMPNPASVIGLLESSGWENWAKRTAVATGKTESQSQKILDNEKKLLKKQIKAADKSGNAIVFDRLNCKQRYQADKALRKAVAG